MAFGRERKSFSGVFVLAVLLLGLLPGCMLARVYKGPEIEVDPESAIVEGTTTKSEILKIFGPPIHIQHQYDGDVFIYAFLRKNSATFAIKDPLITNLTIFSYSRIQQKKDHLVILFDKDGVVKSYGFSRGTEELKFF